MNDGVSKIDLKVKAKAYSEFLIKISSKTVCDKYSVPLPSDFIAHGRPVKPEELPWMVLPIIHLFNP